MDFFVDFRDFAKTAKNSVIKPRSIREKNVKRDNNGMKMAGFTVFAKKKMVSFKS